MWSYLLSDLAPAAAGARSLHILDKSTFREAEYVPAGANQVDEDPDVDRGQRFAQSCRDELDLNSGERTVTTDSIGSMQVDSSRACRRSRAPAEDLRRIPNHCMCVTVQTQRLLCH
jgi:hypothetical protein